ncbi:MAG: hypothetical protein GWP08_13300 [Nitrospiraceae bacterium]|nr:hypothetical protein [Nitrospiraceae bacterium]
MKREIAARGGRAVLLDTSAFPEHVRVTFSPEGVRVHRRKLPLPGAVYVRGLACQPLSPHLDEELRERPRGLMAECREKRAVLESILLHLRSLGVPLVNPPEANAQHGRKPYQLELLRAARAPVPRWIATNDPVAVRRFVREVGDAIYKPLGGGATVRSVEQEDLSDERLSTLAYAPVLFQEHVRGVSVRAFVVGRRVVGAAEIHSPEVDYRRDEQEVVAVRLTAEERRAAVAAARACGMVFTGVDFIRHDTGFSVLECNPSPMFAVFERKTGLDVAGPLADYLLRQRPRRT